MLLLSFWPGLFLVFSFIFAVISMLLRWQRLPFALTPALWVPPEELAVYFGSRVCRPGLRPSEASCAGCLRAFGLSACYRDFLPGKGCYYPVAANTKWWLSALLEPPASFAPSQTGTERVPTRMTTCLTFFFQIYARVSVFQAC